jgi:hypothetical protein
MLCAVSYQHWSICCVQWATNTGPYAVCSELPTLVHMLCADSYQHWSICCVQWATNTGPYVVWRQLPTLVHMLCAVSYQSICCVQTATNTGPYAVCSELPVHMLCAVSYQHWSICCVQWATSPHTVCSELSTLVHSQNMTASLRQRLVALLSNSTTDNARMYVQHRRLHTLWLPSAVMCTVQQNVMLYQLIVTDTQGRRSETNTTCHFTTALTQDIAMP